MSAPTTQTAPHSGQVFHMLSDDGLSITSVYDGPEGAATVKVSWKDIERARDNYANAADGFVERLPELLKKMVSEKRAVQRLRRVGRFNVLISTGPPVWLLPKVRLRNPEGEREFGVGWLYAVIQVFPKGGSS